MARDFFMHERQQHMDYQAPSVTDHGSIAEHTFQTPGKGTKSSDTTFQTDKFGEFSHPAPISGVS